MPRYLSLIRFTSQGVKNLAKSTERARAFESAAKAAGVRVETQLWTLGQYDGALVLAADSEKPVLRVLADLAAQGNVRAETLVALNSQEFDAALGTRA